MTLTKLALAGATLLPMSLIIFFFSLSWDLCNGIGSSVRSHVGRLVDFTACPECSTGDEIKVFLALNHLVEVAEGS